jgi:hypothetical protein
MPDRQADGDPTYFRALLRLAQRFDQRETPERARDIHGVALVGNGDSEDLAVETDATTRLRPAMYA